MPFALVAVQDAQLEAMSKFSFCYLAVPLKKGKPMEGFYEKKQNENLRCWIFAQAKFLFACLFSDIHKYRFL